MKWVRTIADYADQWVQVDQIEMVRTDTNDRGRWCVKAEVGLNRRVVTLCPYGDRRHDFDSRDEATMAALHVLQQMGGVVQCAPPIKRQPVYERGLPDEKPEGQTFGIPTPEGFRQAFGKDL